MERFGIEGSGSYGQGLVSYLRRHDQQVLEAGRPDRRDRRQRGKSDTLDAENAARAVLAGTATATPRRSEGTSEMLRQVKVARDTAVKARTSAIITLKALIVIAPDELRSELQPLTKAVLRDRCAGLRPGAVTTPLAAAKHSLRALARRWQQLDAEIADHDEIVEELTLAAAPTMRQAFGIGPDTAAEMLILAGDRPHERLHSEAAFAKLCGAAPIPASSGMTQRHRLNPAGHRQANSALYRTVIVRRGGLPTARRRVFSALPPRRGASGLDVSNTARLRPDPPRSADLGQASSEASGAKAPMEAQAQAQGSRVAMDARRQVMAARGRPRKYAPDEPLADRAASSVSILVQRVAEVGAAWRAGDEDAARVELQALAAERRC